MASPSGTNMELFPMEGDDAGCTDHPTSNRGDMAQQQADLDDNRKMAFERQDSQVDHSNAPGQKSLF